jgi:NADPH-dependent curcumin reductase CurA
VFEKTLQIHGILVGKLLPKYEDEFYNTVPAQIAAGKLKYFALVFAVGPKLTKHCYRYKEHRYNGLESVGNAILDVQKGNNTGKALIVVAES